ncbi:hypothetical protein LOTGIDRAFT_233114 [Lottia gigantea]|uniref:Uncharacterized protein n=1 Tax=Lottia gigantea TaxID=225164 RepID=V4AG21_LOTGI|nr:hypothetical protein LOTGIDRAFT_233114 [Lottia gigantea]ESO92341.1 hypothetical protein LOTGIDRAFT_233114 [Lottia gigantea]
MAKTILKDSVLWREFIAVVGFLVCLALHIISMSTTHWAWQPLNGDDYKLYGLWRECRLTRVSHICTSFTTGDDNVYKGNEWKKGAQVLTLVGLVSILSQILLSLSIMLVQKIKNNEKEAFGVLMCLLGSYFTCTLLVLLIFGHEIYKIENTQISWSYHIAICSMTLNIMSCVIGVAPLINKNCTCCGDRSININNDKYKGDNMPESSQQISSELPQKSSEKDSGYSLYVRKYQDENGAWMVAV